LICIYGDLLQNRLRCHAKASVGFCCTTRPYRWAKSEGTANMSEFQGQRACYGVMPLSKANKIKMIFVNRGGLW
jgi:hypothetical protein